MMARLLADKFERFNGMIIPQRRRGALPKIVQGGGLRLVHVSPICLSRFEYVWDSRRLAPLVTYKDKACECCYGSAVGSRWLVGKESSLV